MQAICSEKQFKCEISEQFFRLLKGQIICQNVFMKSFSKIPSKKFDRFLSWNFIQTRYVMQSPDLSCLENNQNKSHVPMDNGYVMRAENQRSGQRMAFWAGLKPASVES